MASKHKDEQGRPLQKHTLFLFEGDLDELAAMYPQSKKSRVARHIIHATILRVKGGDRPILIEAENAADAEGA